MSLRTPFIKAEWVSVGKKWNDIPPRVRRVAKQDFLIPNAIRARVLPPPGNSVKQMLEFTLPSYTVSIGTCSPERFFSRNSPDTISDFSITRLRRLPTPAASVVGKLIEFRRQAWLDGYRSVKYCHLHDSVATHFPLWIISFWAEALELRKTVREPWIGAKEWLNAQVRQKISVERRQLAEAAIVLLATLPWDSMPVRTLWRYLGPHWTTGTQQNDLLDILSDHITAQPVLAEHLQVKGLALSAKIIEAAAMQNTTTYKTAQTFRWIRNLGEEVVHGRKGVLTIHHLGEDNQHWVAIVIDGEHETIHYGNSYGTNMPFELLDAYQWWLSQHALSPFAIEKLPITSQEDTSSCGLLSHNSLGHFAFPDTIPLIASSGIQAARMKTFLLMAERIVDQVYFKNNCK